VLGEDGEWLSPDDLKEGRRETAPLVSREPFALSGLKEGVIYEYSTAM
jgi:hypothetical protein